MPNQQFETEPFLNTHPGSWMEKAHQHQNKSFNMRTRPSASRSLQSTSRTEMIQIRWTRRIEEIQGEKRVMTSASWLRLRPTSGCGTSNTCNILSTVVKSNNLWATRIWGWFEHTSQFFGVRVTTTCGFTVRCPRDTNREDNMRHQLPRG